jgi:hypothetical protein
VVHSLWAKRRVHLDRLPRMADFTLWVMACETALWPAGTLTRAYAANRRAAIECIIDPDPIATCIREFMSERSSWNGTARTFVGSAMNAAPDVFRGGLAAGPISPRACQSLATRADRASSTRHRRRL